MKIGFVLDDSLDKVDGVQQYVLTLGHWLKQEGNEVHYIVGETKRNDIRHIHSLSRNVRAHFNQNRMSTPLPAKRANIRKLFADNQFDVLHVQMPYSPMLAGRVIKAAPKETAIVGTFHIVPSSWAESLATRILRLLVFRSLRRLDAVFSVSNPAARFARKSMGLRSLVIPNAVNVSFFHSSREFPPRKDGKVHIVFLGRLVERKGCGHFLEALEYLHQRNELVNVKVTVCSKGPLENILHEYVRKHHLGNVVHFTGFVSEIEKARYLSDADIAVFPSTGGESFGIVLIEAMAAGSRVVLAGDNSGYRSVMQGHSEQLINPKDTKAFALRLRHFIRSQKARTHANKWQLEHVHNYDVRIVGEQLIHQYSQAIAKRRK